MFRDERCDGPARYDAMRDGADCTLPSLADWLWSIAYWPQDHPVGVMAGLLVALFIIATVSALMRKGRRR